MKNAKYNFLKNYVNKTKTAEDKHITSALDFLAMFYAELPERAKGPERRKAWAIIVSELMDAFDKQIEKIANCPFVKIEIADQVEINDILTSLKTYADIDFMQATKKTSIARESYDNAN